MKNFDQSSDSTGSSTPEGQGDDVADSRALPPAASPMGDEALSNLADETLRLSENELSLNHVDDVDVNTSAPSRRAVPRDQWDDLADSVTIPPAASPTGPGETPGADGQPWRFREDESLPNRVDEVDLYATGVTPAAMQMSTTPPAPYTVRSAVPAKAVSPMNPSRVQGNEAPPSSGWRISPKTWGCLARFLILVLFLLVAGLIVAAIAAVMGYYSIASTLPGVEDLRQRSSQFETTRILDRNGSPLYEILDPNAGRRTYVKLNQISPALIAATIATEDKDFYNHPGFDPAAIIRAFWQNYTTDGNGGGASTITQQLARALLLSPDERAERTYTRKAREIILAAEITRTYSKDDILELYLNEIYYGNLAYGIEAASETYFNTKAANLTMAQAAFLAGLPQSPAVYDIHSNRDITLGRHVDVLGLVVQLSQEDNCIAVSNSPERICLNLDEALKAVEEIKAYNFPPPDVNMRYPHWVQFIRSQLESQFDAQTIYRSGFVVYTTLDPTLQDPAQQLLTDQVATLVDNNATNGALVAIRPSTGEILAMVGSADFYNVDIDGQINMAISQTRQPGSSIKPFTYVAAFEKGWTPSTLIWDVPSEFPPSGNPDDPREPYTPVNYDGRFHGPVTVRTALSNSYNIPAVKALQFVGIYDDPTTPTNDGLIGMAQRLGFTSLSRNDYGLALTLGGGDVSLLEMAGGYAVLANNGKRIPPVAILKITDHTGNVVYEYQVPEGEQVVRAEHAFLMTSILSDTVARQPMFGANPVINLPFPAAAKTGTTNDFRDNWTMGYTADLAVGVWVGNADYTPMQNTTGLSGAAPIWAGFMQEAAQRLSGGNPTPFTRPSGIVDMIVCSVSGTQPSRWCPDQRGEIFASDQPPLPSSQDLWNEARVDTWTGLLASPACEEFVDEKMTLNVTDRFARAWLRRDNNGRAWAESIGFERPIFFTPDRECKPEDSHATLDIRNIHDGDTLTEERMEVRIVANATAGFERWHLDLADGHNPGDDDWDILVESDNQVREPADVYRWLISKAGNGEVSLRLRMEHEEGGYAERVLHITIDYNPPTATPAPTSTITDIPVPTDTRRPPNTDVPTDVPTNTPVPPTAIPVPSDTPFVPTDVPPIDTPIPPDPILPTATPASY